MQLAGLIDLIFDQSNNCVLPADDQITWWPWHVERIVREATYLRYKFISWLVDCCTWGDTHVNIQICTTSYIFTLRESRLRGNSSHIRHATTDRVREGDKRNMSCLIQRWNQVYVANLYSEPRTQAEDKTICWNKASMTSCAAPHCLCPSGPVVCLMKKSQISMDELDWNLTGKGNILTFRTSQKQGASTESWCSTIGIQLQICWNVEKHRIGENSDTNRIFSLYWTNNITFSFVGIFRF